MNLISFFPLFATYFSPETQESYVQVEGNTTFFSLPLWFTQKIPNKNYNRMSILKKNYWELDLTMP